MLRLISTCLAAGVAIFATSGALRAQPPQFGAVETEAAAAEADKAAGQSGDFQLNHSFACETTTCSHTFYKVPKGKTLNLTSFSCFTTQSPMYLVGFHSDKSGENTVVTPTSNGANYYIGVGYVPLTIRGGDKLVYIDVGTAIHTVSCLVRGQLH